MKRTAIIAVLAAFSVALTQQAIATEGTLATKPHPGAGWVQGSVSPESIPEWVALSGALSAVERLEAENSGNGRKYLMLAAGLTPEGADAVLTYNKAAKVFALAPKGASMRQDLCAKRSQITTSRALAVELQRRGDAGEQRARAQAEGVYTVLSKQDATALRAYAQNARSKTVIYQVTDYVAALASVDPRSFLSALCGR